jgi:hypothetical protein
MRREKTWLLILIAALAASVFLNVIQGRQLKVRADLSTDSLSPGVVVSTLKVKDLSGRYVSLKFDDTTKPTVLYVFAPSCRWCKRNSASMRALVDQMGQQYRFIGISLYGGDVQEFLKNSNSGISTYYTDPTDGSVAKYKLFSTPTTLVISPEGKVLRFWVGAYVGDTKSEIERFFSVQLPQAGS